MATAKKAAKRRAASGIPPWPIPGGKKKSTAKKAAKKAPAKKAAKKAAAK